MKKWLSGVGSLILLWSLFHPTIIQAAEMDFSVHADLPENQLNKKNSYFDLKVKPKQMQTITVSVQNTSKKTEKIAVRVRNAATNQNGVIDYTESKIKKDPSLKVGLEDIIQQTKQEISLAPKEAKKVSFQLKMPSKPFEGAILGGIEFEKLGQDNHQKKKNLSIQNEYSYVIGVQLQETDKNLIQPKLHLVDAQADLMNYRPVVTATLQNDQPVILHDLKIKATVTKKKDKNFSLTQEKSGMSMAPNSHFDFPIALKGETMKAGSYHIQIQAEAEKGKYHWTLSKNFEVTKEQTDRINQESIHAQKNPFPIWGYILIGAGIILLLVCIYLLYKNRKLRSKRRK